MSHFLNCRGRLLDLSRPVVMGILNATPDSFFEKSRTKNEFEFLTAAEKMISEGAILLDIGGQSTRPGATQVPENEELARILPAIQAIQKRWPQVFISVDTFYKSVARAAVGEGCDLINDISAGQFDDGFFEEIARLSVPYFLMHQPHRQFSAMHQRVENEAIELEVLDFLIQKIGHLRSLDVKDLVIDPGFGFGKTVENNFRLLQNLHVLKILGLPIMAGLSRKSMIWRSLGGSPDTALNGTTALNMVALQQGATILRVHDVREAVETIHLFELLKS